MFKLSVCWQSFDKFLQYLKYEMHLKESSKAGTGSRDSADDFLEDEVDQRIWAEGPKANRPVYQTAPGSMANLQLMAPRPVLALVADTSQIEELQSLIKEWKYFDLPLLHKYEYAQFLNLYSRKQQPFTLLSVSSVHLHFSEESLDDRTKMLVIFVSYIMKHEKTIL